VICVRLHAMVLGYFLGVLVSQLHDHLGMIAFTLNMVQIRHWSIFLGKP